MKSLRGPGKISVKKWHLAETCKKSGHGMKIKANHTGRRAETGERTYCLKLKERESSVRGQSVKRQARNPSQRILA